MGDLNEVTNANKILPAYKGNSTRYSKSNKFWNTNGLIDIDHLGIPFKWYNKREVINAISACLNKALAKMHWLKVCPVAILYNLPISGQTTRQFF